MLRLCIINMFLTTLLGSSAGKNLVKIVGGQKYDIQNFPHQVALIYYNHLACGGAIISSQWIITAAHCLSTADARMFQVRIGTSQQDAGGTLYSVILGTTHPKYVQGEYDYDVGLLQINGKISFSNAAQRISVANYEMLTGTQAWVSGYGSTSAGGSPTNHLSAVMVTIQDRHQCASTYSQIYQITDRMFCAADSFSDACQGDSGGPIVFGGMLYGVVSFGIGCASHFPGVYVNLAESSIRQFIRNITFV